MYRRKVEYYSARGDALARQRITHQPLVFMCYGRPAPEQPLSSALSRPNSRGGAVVVMASRGAGV
eukprot:5795247-Lingulodinium_polyedra.AAC.1